MELAPILGKKGISSTIFTTFTIRKFGRAKTHGSIFQKMKNPYAHSSLIHEKYQICSWLKFISQ
jgi:hypothetical protein